MNNEELKAQIEASLVFLNYQSESPMYDDDAPRYARYIAEQISQPMWKYPEKGELPPAKEGWNHSQRVLVYYEGGETQVDAYSLAYYHYQPPFMESGFVDWNHPGRPVKCWQHITPPTQQP